MHNNHIHSDKSIPLVLDSTVLKQVPKLNSELFQELVKYTNANIYKLYLSEITEKEYLSWVKIEAQNSFDKMTKTMNLLNSYYEEPSLFGLNLISDIRVSVVGSQINGILNGVMKNWEEFKEKTGVTVMPIQKNHGKLVMDAYFIGGKPFSKIKNRSDIPDAFIYFSLNDLLNKNEKVVFVSGDKKFSKAIQNEKLICFENLSDLFSKGPSKLDTQFFNSLDDENRVFILIKIYADEISRKLAWEIESSITADDIVRDISDQVIGEYTYISTDVLDLKVHINEIKNISKLSFLIPFSAKLHSSIQSLAAKDDLISLSDYQSNNVDREVDDDGNSEIYEHHHYSVRGHFSLSLGETDPSTWKMQKKPDSIWSKNEIAEIQVTLEDLLQTDT